MAWKSLFYFDEVRRVERKAINDRRAARSRNKRLPIASNPVATPPYREDHVRPEGPRRDREPTTWATGTTLSDTLSSEEIIEIQGGSHTRASQPDARRTRPEPEPCDANGLALSGGGIRSAAFSLGVMQALNSRNLLLDFDYLSTVSGGGYVGASFTAALNANGGTFPFASGNGDIRDAESVGHLRNYSNYLLPRNHSALRNLADAAVIVARGILTNFLVLLPVFLFLVLIVAFTYAAPATEGSSFISAFVEAVHRKSLHGDIALLNVQVSSIVVLLVAASAAVTHRRNLVKAWTVAFFSLTTVFLILLAAGISFWLSGRASSIVSTSVGSSWIDQAITPLLSAIEAQQVGFGVSLYVLFTLLFLLLIWSIIRSNSRAAMSDVSSFYLTLNRRLLYLLSITICLEAVPYAIRFVDASPFDALLKSFPGSAALAAAIVAAGTIIAIISDRLSAATRANARKSGLRAVAILVGSKGLLLLASLILPIAGVGLFVWFSARAAQDRWFDHFAVWIVAALTLYLTSLLRPNAYSLHQFYRDRLQAAFLSANNYFSAVPTVLAFNDAPKLSKLNPAIGPYHLLNTALNLQGSSEANQRGREADFFAFSSQFVGSDLTLYTPTRDDVAGFATTSRVEAEDVALDLASVVAISGAAASANMGGNTIRALTPSLALLNVRLGYWLNNPRRPIQKWSTWFFTKPLDKLYLLKEIFGLLDEKSSQIYLTDGGHIENLGIYELLKRGCQLIVAVDAEADPAMAFPSLLKLERYARIDLGVRINLPWKLIGRQNYQGGSHAVAGTIQYPDGSEGVLIYIKSSLTGDERDYVTDYHERHPAFPHEATSDQFFTEEQFEVYRSLGFHATDRIFGREIPLPCDWKLWDGEAADQRVFDLLRTHFPSGDFPDTHQRGPW